MYARLLILAAIFTVAAVQPVPSATAAPYFEGKKVTLLVG